MEKNNKTGCAKYISKSESTKKWNKMQFTKCDHKSESKMTGVPLAIAHMGRDVTESALC